MRKGEDRPGFGFQEVEPGLFAIEGRRGRRSFFVHTMMIGLLNLVLVLGLFRAYGVDLDRLSAISNDLRFLSALLTLPGTILIGIYLAQRCRDAGLSVWYVFLMPIPIVSSAFYMALLFLPKAPPRAGL